MTREVMCELRLLDVERTSATMGPSVHCVTVYVTQDQSGMPTEALFRQHARLVVSNPWLAGRLVRPPSGEITVRYGRTGLSSDVHS